MAYLYVPGLGASTSGSDLLNPLIEQSVMSRGRLMRRQYWSSAWKKGGWIRLLFGIALKPSTANRGVESWILSLRASPASPTQSPDGSKVTKTSDTSGPNSSESSGKSGPPWCSSKTSQNSLPGFDLSEKNYQDWVTTLRRDSLRRQKSAHLTSDNGCSLWLTPKIPSGGSQIKRLDPGGGLRKLEDQAEGRQRWRTPGASDGEGGVMEIRPETTGHYKLRDQAAVWCTPKSRDWRSGKQEQQSRDDLNIQVHTLQDQKNTPFGTKSTDPTPNSPPLWVTPRQQDHKHGEATDYELNREKGKDLLHVQVNRVVGHKKKLNPLFVEWLMGLPIGWTDLEPVETPSSPKPQP